MTYCVGLKLDRGIVFMSDTRTNAGVDNISVFRKMFRWETDGERSITLMTAGNLATTQAVVSLLNERALPAEERGSPSILEAPSMFQAARLVGETLREVIHTQTEEDGQSGEAFTATMILGGQVRGGEPRLYLPDFIVLISFIAFIGVLGWYWVFGWLVVSGVASAGYPLSDAAWFALCTLLCLVGIAIMIAADAQKYFTLQVEKGLITTGMFRYIRHPNYLGEMMIYGSFALLVWHWLPALVLAFVWCGVFAVNMRVKEESMSRYPEWAAYRARTGWLLPRIF